MTVRGVPGKVAAAADARAAANTAAADTGLTDTGLTDTGLTDTGLTDGGSGERKAADTGAADAGAAGAGGGSAYVQRAAAADAMRRAARLLLARQDSQGSWTGRTAGDVSLDAEAVLVREFLEIGSPDLTRASAQQLRSAQQPDGSWIGDGEPGKPGDLAASVLAYLALRLAGDPADAYHMAVAAGWIRDAGGIAAAGLVTRVWLATFGLTAWEDIHVPGPEMLYLPVRSALANGGRADWSRLAAVTLTIIGTLRPVRRLPFEVTELDAGSNPADPWSVRSRPLQPNVAQRAALRRCGQWLTDWQLRPGLPTGRRAVWPCSLIALRQLGYPLRQPALSEGLAWLDSVTARRLSHVPAAELATGSPRRTADRQPPVRETALAVLALADAGLPADHPALAAAGSWLLSNRIEGPPESGPQACPAAVGWSFGRDAYPMPGDTAQVLLALSRIDLAGRAGKSAITGALRWLAGVQGRDGGWGRCAEVTALCVQALATHGAPDGRALRRGVVWLLRAQRAGGSWPGRPPAGEPEDIRATTAALPALLVAGVLPGKPPVRSAVEWLLHRQNMDAGWSGTAAGASDPDATALALAALVAAGGPETSDPADLSADWLVHAQQADGGWGDRSRSRRRSCVVPGLVRPLAALGRYALADH